MTGTHTHVSCHKNSGVGVGTELRCEIVTVAYPSDLGAFKNSKWRIQYGGPYSKKSIFFK